ncbi:MAG: hypothetical protein CBC12_06720 [Candidatus Puniceispirillum sp. TMED52]|nr:hypothetical protein [SAR116 cluster bacterium]OUU49890.1 MAG: hypothetical protein CBC12_06720 [Candidatus Puniceispirillum sp. TMED52]
MTLRALKAEASGLGAHAARLCAELCHAADHRQNASVIILAAALLDVALREPTGPASTADGAAIAEARDSREAYWLRERRNGIVHYEGGRGGFMGDADDDAILAEDAARAIAALTEALAILNYG